MFPRMPSTQQSKSYFVRTGKDEYVTVFSGFNPQTRKMQVMVTNSLKGTPPPGMPEMDKATYARVRSGKVNGMQNLEKS